jgi:hypothetical protein
MCSDSQRKELVLTLAFTRKGLNSPLIPHPACGHSRNIQRQEREAPASRDRAASRGTGVPRCNPVHGWTPKKMSAEPLQDSPDSNSSTLA